MTAVGMQLNDGQKLVIELNKGGFQKKLLIHIDDYLLDLTQFDLRRQELPGMDRNESNCVYRKNECWCYART